MTDRGNGWSDEAPKGDMFIWARPKGDGTWGIGMGYHNVSGGLSTEIGRPLPKDACRFKPIGKPPLK